MKADAWPYPVIEVFLGKSCPDAALAASGTPDSRCEAQFYVGEWYLLKGNSSKAASSFQAALVTCPKNFFEYAWAGVELKRLKL